MFALLFAFIDASNQHLLSNGLFLHTRHSTGLTGWQQDGSVAVRRLMERLSELKLVDRRRRHQQLYSCSRCNDCLKVRLVAIAVPDKSNACHANVALCDRLLPKIRKAIAQNVKRHSLAVKEVDVVFCILFFYATTSEGRY